MRLLNFGVRVDRTITDVLAINKTAKKRFRILARVVLAVNAFLALLFNEDAYSYGVKRICLIKPLYTMFCGIVADCAHSDNQTQHGPY
jgi:hypothetical protein